MNQAQTLMLSFISWKFEETPVEYAGAARQLAREEIKRIFLNSLYSHTPNKAPTRQLLRSQARSDVKEQRKADRKAIRQARRGRKK